MKKILKKFFIILIILSVYSIASYYFDTYKTKKEIALLQKYITTNISENIIDNNTPTNETTPQNTTNEAINTTPQIVKTERMLKVEELKKQNPDIIGWIEIENTDINYPVLQCSDNTYYINHNYKKEKSKNGAIFLDKDYNWDLPSTNLLIYGHNMKNNTMFQHLLKYENKSFFTEHPIIKFSTVDEDSIYEIISVFKSKVYYQSEQNVFRYYYFINATSENDFNDYIQNVKKASLYDTEKTAVYGDKLMTLSTCSYHTKDGRFVVVAKKLIKFL